jgi:hypothetical protein
VPDGEKTHLHRDCEGQPFTAAFVGDSEVTRLRWQMDAYESFCFSCHSSQPSQLLALRLSSVPHNQVIIANGFDRAADPQHAESAL